VRVWKQALLKILLQERPLPITRPGQVFSLFQQPIFPTAPSIPLSAQSGDIHASISEQDGGMVRFLEGADDVAGSLASKKGLARR
jgi:hypothetical protein